MILLILLLLSRLVLLAHKFCLIPNINYHSFMFFFFLNMYISVINQTVISVLTKYYDSDTTFAARYCLFGFPEVNGT